MTSRKIVLSLQCAHHDAMQLSKGLLPESLATILFVNTEAAGRHVKRSGSKAYYWNTNAATNTRHLMGGLGTRTWIH